MFVQADRRLCATTGQCSESLPEVFANGDEDGVVEVLQPRPQERLWQEVRDTARRCPVAAILVTEP